MLELKKLVNIIPPPQAGGGSDNKLQIIINHFNKKKIFFRSFLIKKKLQSSKINSLEYLFFLLNYKFCIKFLHLNAPLRGRRRGPVENGLLKAISYINSLNWNQTMKKENLYKIIKTIGPIPFLALPIFN